MTHAEALAGAIEHVDRQARHCGDKGSINHNPLFAKFAIKYAQQKLLLEKLVPYAEMLDEVVKRKEGGYGES